MCFILGQSNLLKSSVLVIGAGGLGSPALLYLAACGVGMVSDSTSNLSTYIDRIVSVYLSFSCKYWFSLDYDVLAISSIVFI